LTKFSNQVYQSIIWLIHETVLFNMAGDDVDLVGDAHLEVSVQNLEVLSES
jgi:hypothetical protein